MKLKMTGRHMDLTPALRRHVESRFERLDRYGLKLGTVQVIMSVEKLQHKAEAMCMVSHKPAKAAQPRSVRALAATAPPAPALAVERRAVPLLALGEVEKRLANHTEAFMLFVHADTGTIHVASWAPDGDILVVEPYPESGRSRSASSRKR